MKFSDELMSALPGGDWQRIETWAAIAGITPAQYLSLCIRRGHELNKQDLKKDGFNLKISPGLENVE
jgi:hypothetical protein